jgi:hypothetical protein
LYLGVLLPLVEQNSWIVVVDDDAIVVDDHYVDRMLASIDALDVGTVYLQPILYGKERAYLPANCADASTGHFYVDMANLVFHRSHVPLLRFSERCAQDKRMLSDFISAGLRVAVLRVPIGIWANRSGKGEGRSEAERARAARRKLLTEVAVTCSVMIVLLFLLSRGPRTVRT